MDGNSWLQGPPVFLQNPEDCGVIDSFPEMETERQAVPPEEKQQCTMLGSKRFERFSRWDSLVRALSRLRTFTRKSRHSTDIEASTENDSKHVYTETETFIMKQVQQEMFEKEISCIKMKSPLPKDSPIAALNPVLDADGVLRVGGRLGKSDLERNLKHPVIISGKHYVAVLLVRHHHDLIQHQGRHFTEGALRSAGWWIMGVKRLVSSVIHKCVTCKKLRGQQETQIMADLPADRLTRSPPFTYVGVDTFGPWEVITRKTRGGVAYSKRWAILFNCLVTRAIHIEVTEEMSTSSSINALRRFVALRGKVQQFRSDRGTNFLGATEILKVDTVNVEDKPVQDFLSKEQAKWLFNPPHSSHIGGSWERMIGPVRRILDRMMSNVSPKKFTHEVLTTFMAEVSAIVNSRPIVPVSSDPEQPHLLTPATLLTQKTDHVVSPLKGCTGSIKELYLKEWKQVQALADMFWNRFRAEYLQTLQQRQKWQHGKENIKDGDVVLLKEKNIHRNDWPVGRVINAIPSSDAKVRKAEVQIVRDGKIVTFTRPITEIIHLLSPEI
ncbi:uncharacterized protein LOC124287683 [Haliotis rubra]|uniref:uncharacterized protein LOC124287683 n=1 Tax=Haliotis rubra TaxID=36100 RepID=UPI001EE59DC3|nr:uncharacterized protein LOC124287683 [Haliotis rubra]